MENSKAVLQAKIIVLERNLNEVELHLFSNTVFDKITILMSSRHGIPIENGTITIDQALDFGTTELFRQFLINYRTRLQAELFLAKQQLRELEMLPVQ